MIAIGNGEPCPVCKKLISDNAEVTMMHMQKEHPSEFHKALFEDEDIGI